MSINIDQQNLQPEDSGVKAKPILMFLGILAASTVFVFVLIRVLLWGFDKLDRANQKPPATEMRAPNGRVLPPEPLLQGAPGSGSTDSKNTPTMLPLDDMKNYKERLHERMDGYGWINKEAGMAYMPIERAKEMMIEKGLPVKSNPAATTEMERAEAMRSEYLAAASNSGRNLRSKPQPVNSPTPQTSVATAPAPARAQ